MNSAWVIVPKALLNSTKGSAQFLYLCNLPKSGASSTYTTFPRITSKTDIFRWLELITVVLCFLTLFGLKKIKRHNSENLPGNHCTEVVFQKDYAFALRKFFLFRIFFQVSKCEIVLLFVNCNFSPKISWKIFIDK